ncbi:MAG: sodium-dependent transporter [Bacteroidales bacterium]|nr:sodium-dependent transporter [Bacteroidales bacterium]
MAMAGSAIGLGNIWRFPYMVGEHGGGAFIIAYIVCSAFIALPCFLCEAVIGKRARSGVYGSFEKLAPGSKWKWAGGISILACFVIMSYYSVVGGWSLDFLVRSLSGGLAPGRPDEAVGIFSKMASSPLESITGFLLFLMATALIVLGGIKKGIEKFTKITIPILFVLMIALVVYSLSLPGSGGGVKYIIEPDFSKLDASGWACALGQAFFSMSLGVGAVLIYSSFMKKDERILRAGVWTSVSDTFFAIISALAIMPAVFASGLEPGVGPALVYETLPYIFASMGVETPVLSAVVTTAFFLAILMAALTSSISMLDVCVEHAVEQYKCKRWMAMLLFVVPGIALGVPCALSFGSLKGATLFGLTIFDICDFLCSNILMTLGALVFALFVGWRMKKADVQEELNGPLFKVFYFMIRWVVPPAILIIFISNLL